MNTIRNLIRFTIILILVIIPIYIFFVVPKYPSINASFTKEYIVKEIIKIVDKNTQIFVLENMNNKQKILSYQKDFEQLDNNIVKCSSNECMINEYNNFMNKWVVTDIKANSRFFYISNNLGFIGNIMNENLYWMYSI
ncbi:hypothetical protein ABE179_05640 [Aliarcobacter skirrowii]|uniref:hypothetical protein n=1 Tax=Aliarcobacter skirrowii TaxID=28200 RepID=UPI0021B28B0F|nr:hypothetical protein [Aliarcobacter skirrowii]MCT7446448.1 hypothetical protein [Aliarcobacter skirrowii]